jgi:hypothetical protein
MILIDLHSFTSLKNSVQSQPVTWDISWHTQYCGQADVINDLSEMVETT